MHTNSRRSLHGARRRLTVAGSISAPGAAPRDGVALGHSAQPQTGL